MKTQLLNSLQFNGTGQSSLTVIIPFPLSFIPPSHISIMHVDKNEMVLRQQKKIQNNCNGGQWEIAKESDVNSP